MAMAVLAPGFARYLGVVKGIKIVGCTLLL